MYKKLLDEDIKSVGGLNGFILSMRREVKIWKLVAVLLILSVLFISQRSFNPFGEAITTKSIPSIRSDIIAEIRLEGAIMPDLKREKLLDAIYKSKKIKGLIIVVNSPGGDPNSSEILYDKIKKIGNNIPVVAFVEGAGASGSYMAAMAAHKIIALKTAYIGSIGVISSNFNFTNLMRTLGIGYEEYATSEFKGAGSPFMKTNDIQKKYRQDIMMQVFTVFKGMVKEARNLTDAELAKVANAKVFLGAEALKLKLIDEIGTKDRALEILSKILEEQKLKDLPVQEINPEPQGTEGFIDRISLSMLKIFANLRGKIGSPNLQTTIY